MTVPKLIIGQTTSTDKINPPPRIILNGEKGVFLNKQKEDKTLQLFLTMDQLADSVNTTYFLNENLKERIRLYESRTKELEIKKEQAEDRAIKAVSDMTHYRDLYRGVEAENKKLRGQIVQLKIYKVGSIGLGITTLGFGIAYLLNK